MPALPTKQSNLPKRLTASLTALELSPSEVTSPTVTATRAPNSSRSAADRSGERSSTATFAPSSIKRATTACPSPDAPPVTSATLPSSHATCGSFVIVVSEKKAQVAGEHHRLIQNDP